MILIFPLLILGSAGIGWGTMYYLPTWAIWVWVALALVTAWAIVVRSRYIGTVILNMIMWFCAVAPLIGTYFVMMNRLASRIAFGWF
jgi:hypothetical protein